MPNEQAPTWEEHGYGTYYGTPVDPVEWFKNYISQMYQNLPQDLATGSEQIVEGLRGGGAMGPGPVGLLTKKMFAEQLMQSMPSGINPELFLSKLPRKAVTDLSQVLPITKYEDFKPSIRAAFKMDTAKTRPETIGMDRTPWEMFVGEQSRSESVFHETGHKLYFDLTDGPTREAMSKVFNKLSKKQFTDLSGWRGTWLNLPSEYFAEAYAAYIANAPVFEDVHPFVKHLVKRFHRLAK